jgi:hypothetical protein
MTKGNDFKLTDLLVSDTPIEREVEIKGEVHSFFFKQLTAIQVRRFAIIEQSGTPDEVALEMVKVIQSSLCDENGKLVFTLEEAKKINPKALLPLFYASMKASAGIPDSPEEAEIKK